MTTAPISQPPQQTVSFQTVFILLVLLSLLLRLLTTLLWWSMPGLITAIGPGWDQLTQVVPVPVMVVLLPFAIAAFVIFAMPGSLKVGRKTHPIQHFPPAAETVDADNDAVERARLYSPRYTFSEIGSVVRVLAAIFAAMFLWQFVVWLSFYRTMNGP